MVRAELIRLIGGPTGPDIGVTGAVGPVGGSIMGPTGIIGALGRRGMTGSMGAAGVFAALAGAMGRGGPFGVTGYPGHAGMTGRSALVPDASYLLNAVNSNGYGPFDTARMVGCKFKYPVKNVSATGSYVFAFFSAQFEDTAATPTFFYTSIFSRTGTAPEPGAAILPSGEGVFPEANIAGNVTEVKAGAVGRKLPLFWCHMARYYPPSIYPAGYFPVEVWFDLAASSQISANGSYVTGGVLSNITATIFEVPV